MLNARRQSILRYLASADGDVTMARIGADLGLSPRQVRYDLEWLGRALPDWGMQLVCRRGSGIRLDGDRSRLRGRLATAETGARLSYDYVLTPPERRRMLALHLLLAGRSLTMKELATLLYVSRGTVRHDLDELQVWLAERGLVLERRGGGPVVNGSERKWRRAAVELLVELVVQEDVARLLRPGSPGEGWEEVLPLVPAAGVLAVTRAVRRVQGTFQLPLSDQSLVRLLAHLLVAIDRLSRGKQLEALPDPPPALRGRREWRAAAALCREVELAAGLPVPPAEVREVAVLLLTAGLGPEADRLGSRPGAEEVALARELVSRAEALLGVPLHDDSRLVAGLALHLKPVPHRLRDGDPIENPLLQEVQGRYPAVYRAAAAAAGAVLQDAWQVPVPPGEVGYITIHLAAALERCRARPPQTCRVLVVCGAGIGTAHLLAARIEAELPEVQITGLASVFSLGDPEVLSQADLVVTTGAVSVGATPVVRVNPLLDTRDVERLKAAVHDRMTQKTKKGRRPMLLDVLSPDAIVLDAVAEDWEAAIRLSGGVLVQTGAVEGRYVDAMIRMVREAGPYIVISPGIALAHARPEEGVHRIAISLVRLRRPVAFGHKQNDPVDLVFTLAASDSDSHLTALMQLAELLLDPVRVQQIRRAGVPGDIIELVRRTPLPEG